MANANDVRAVLQYVPQFRGRVFLVLIEAGLLPEPAVAETLLDLAALESVGVKFVLGVLGGDVNDLYDWTLECEIRSARLSHRLGAPGAIEEARTILARGQTPVVDASSRTPLDEEVVAFALGIGAVKLITLLSETILIHGEPRHAISIASAFELADAPDVTGRDLLLAAAHACQRGIPRVHVLNGHRQGVLVEELFSNEGVGTMVHADAYQEIRSLREEDIPELLGMIGRSVRRSRLIPRDYEGIRQKLADYHVLTVDGNVVGCVALHEYPEQHTAELACLYVKHSHENRGYGHILAHHAEQLAASRRIPWIYALTNQAKGFFGDHLHYQPASKEVLPPSRRAQLENSGRDSLVFVRNLDHAE